MRRRMLELPAAVLLVTLGQLLWLRQATAIPIDNGVRALPEVDCGERSVRLVFRTERPFSGRIFVKGQAERPECSTSFPASGASSVVFQLPAGTCNMRRQRRLGPQRGVEQSMTVIISFHDTFITKVDRAYRCTCFYMEADKVVTSRFEVSMIPTTDLVDTARMPLCTYSVRRGSTSGEVVSYAQVGDEIYHVWQCESDMFGMLVHSCFVDDGRGDGRFQLLDENGCAMDSVILSDLTYNAAVNMAWVEAHAFKFADKVTTYFQCAVSLCMSGDGACQGITPPRCTRNSNPQSAISQFGQQEPEGPYRDPQNSLQSQSNVRPPVPPSGADEFDRFPTEEDGYVLGATSFRDTRDYVNYEQLLAEAPEAVPADDRSPRFRYSSRRRHAREAAPRPKREGDLDVAAERILVMDIDEVLPMPDDHYNVLRHGERGAFGSVGAEESSVSPPGHVCVSTLGFGVLLALFIVVTTASLLVLTIHWQRHYRGQTQPKL